MSKDYLIIDGSYFIYFNMFSAWKAYRIQNKLENTDNDFEPCNDPEFVDLVLKRLYSRLTYNVNEIIGRKYDIDTENMTIYFPTDCSKKDNWRMNIASTYKISRTLPKKSEFNIRKTFSFIKDYICTQDSVFRSAFKIIPLFSENCEGDDIVAVLVKHIIKDANKIFLLASDRDFLQLADDVIQLEIGGKEVTIEGYTKGEKMSAKEFTLLKILAGDGSDDIKGVFPGHALKRCMKLLKNRDELKAKLHSNTEYIKSLNNNKALIDFDLIPEEMVNRVITDFKIVTESIKEQTENSLDTL